MILEDPATVFDRWAEVYDEQLNPLLALEERTLLSTLPVIDGRDLLDVGCGTGRWLNTLCDSNAASLTGIDVSTAMLARAAAKLGQRAKICSLDGASFPVDDGSIDILLSSFVLSYISDVQTFAQECARVTRAGATVLLSDMHPQTAAARNWKRSFRAKDTSVEVPSYPRSIEAVLAVFQKCGFTLSLLKEPSFSPLEQPIFEAAGKLEDFFGLAGLPAIYILALKKAAPPLELLNARCAVDHAISVDASITLQHGLIADIHQNASSAHLTLDLGGYLLLPGLINAHDHLEFGLFPNLGREASAAPYKSATEWANEIHQTHADLIAKHRLLPKSIRLWWGAIRNLLCGVTTVCHHNELYPEFNETAFPVHVLAQFGWAHSLTFDTALPEKLHATPDSLPFILHAAEGVDAASADEIFQLERMHMLNAQTVLVHGLALDPAGIAMLNRHGAALITCPTSNRFLFHRLPSCSQLQSIERLALGSDSPLTAAGDLLDEVRCAHHDIGLDAKTLYEMVTTRSASLLRLQLQEGYIEVNAIADLIAVGDTRKTPANTLATLTWDQVELVLLAGRVQLASEEIYHRLSEELRHGLQPLLVDGLMRWLRAPIQNLLTSAEALLGSGQIVLGGKRVDHVASL